MKNKKYSIVLLAGGKGSRMHETIPKQYLLLAGKPIIMHSLERIDRLASINEIIIVCEQYYEGSLKQMFWEYNIQTKCVFANAGSNRQESVYNGLQMVSNEDVIIHEAARPFVKQDEFQTLIDEEEANVIYGYDIPYTVLKGKDCITGILNRFELINVQLPQKFNMINLLDAYRITINNGNIYTEDASLLFANSNVKIKVLKGTCYNIKITEPIDLQIGEIIYRDYIMNRK